MKVKPVIKYKTGMKVRVKDTLKARSNHKEVSGFYPCPGTVGVIKDMSFVTKSEVCLLVQWELGSTSGNDEWYIDGNDVEVIT